MSRNPYHPPSDVSYFRSIFTGFLCLVLVFAGLYVWEHGLGDFFRVCQNKQAVNSYIDTYFTTVLNDPSSLQIVSITDPVKNEQGDTVTICTFRAKNAFGALVLSKTRFQFDPDGTVIVSAIN